MPERSEGTGERPGAGTPERSEGAGERPGAGTPERSEGAGERPGAGTPGGDGVEAFDVTVALPADMAALVEA
jgi:hypothetical protein